jgi:hypothetical protein
VRSGFLQGCAEECNWFFIISKRKGTNSSYRRKEGAIIS